VTDLACCISNVATVTLYDTLGAESTEYIMNQCELKTIFCTSDHIDSLLEIKNSSRDNHLENIISFNDISADEIQKSKNSGVNLTYIDELIQEGNKLSVELDNPRNKDVFTICYTSGTTGNPKGVKLHHGCITSMVAGIEVSPIRLLVMFISPTSL